MPRETSDWQRDGAKPIRLSRHALDRLADRGVTEDEVLRTIRGRRWRPADGGRMEARSRLMGSYLWQGRPYHCEHVRPIFDVRGDAIVVVTVYCYYS